MGLGVGGMGTGTNSLTPLPRPRFQYIEALAGVTSLPAGSLQSCWSRSSPAKSRSFSTVALFLKLCCSTEDRAHAPLLEVPMPQLTFRQLACPCSGKQSTPVFPTMAGTAGDPNLAGVCIGGSYSRRRRRYRDRLGRLQP